MVMRMDPESAARIARQVERGRSPVAETVVADSLGRRVAGETELADLRAKIQLGLDDVARGDWVDVTPGFWRELHEEAEAAFERGEQPDADVCP